MSPATTPDTLDTVTDHAQHPVPDPQVAVDLMLAEVEVMRAQLGLAALASPEPPELRDLSPFGR